MGFKILNPYRFTIAIGADMSFMNYFKGDRYHIVAIFLLVFFFVYRLDSLDSVPGGFFCDEASIAVNARSILESGKDEHGVVFPVYFRAFGDFKPGFYIYATSLSFLAFGESHLTTRLPAAIFLALAMAVVYILLAMHFSPVCGIVAVIMLGFEPWLNHYSHIAFGLSAIPFLLGLSLFFWHGAVKGKYYYFPISAFFFSLTFYSYPPARLFVPLFVLGLIIIYRKDIFSTQKSSRFFYGFLGTSFVMAIPFAYYLFYVDGFTGRLDYLNIFTTPFIEHAAGFKGIKEFVDNHGYSIDINKKNFLTRALVGVWNYFAYLSPDNLFFHGDSNLRFGISRFGLYGTATMIGVLAGLVFMVIRRSKFDKMLILWLLIYPIPGSLTWEDIPHSGRGIVGLLGISIIGAMGIWYLTMYLKGVRRSWLRRCLLGLYILILICLYLNHSSRYHRYYMTNYSRDSGGWMQFGFARMMDYVEQNHAKYEKVILMERNLHYQPYIFVLYYSGISPEEWRYTGKLPWNVEIKNRLNRADYRENVLYVIPGDRHFGNGLHQIDTIKWEDNVGVVAIIYEYRDSG